MDPKGHVLIKKEFTATKIWPAPELSIYPPYIIDLEIKYKKALAGKLVTVMDICVADTGYLVLGKAEGIDPFIWMIEKEDTVDGSFIPVIMKYGTLMPAGLSAMEELAILAANVAHKTAKYRNFQPLYYVKYRYKTYENL
jgi:hypothetical protein